MVLRDNLKKEGVIWKTFFLPPSVNPLYLYVMDFIIVPRQILGKYHNVDLE